MNSIVPPGSGPKAVNSSGMAIICSITPETSQNRVFQRAENGKLYTIAAIATPPCLQCARLAAGSTVRQAFRSSQQKRRTVADTFSKIDWDTSLPNRYFQWQLFTDWVNLGRGRYFQNSISQMPRLRAVRFCTTTTAGGCQHLGAIDVKGMWQVIGVPLELQKLVIVYHLIVLQLL